MPRRDRSLARRRSLMPSPNAVFLKDSDCARSLLSRAQQVTLKLMRLQTTQPAAMTNWNPGVKYLAAEEVSDRPSKDSTSTSVSGATCIAYVTQHEMHGTTYAPLARCRIWLK